ncbi:MAG: orotidine-5'-phosphate decarboxylase [Gammaproteobacteria bacterium]|nr:orotidine-5'-phosphate decarboxylase [Gammaproteobacteria bacterium]
MIASSPIIIALDCASAAGAVALVECLPSSGYSLKIGKELFTREGPPVVHEFVARGIPVFLDLKFHDIPNTVAAACRAAAELGVWMVNVHISGGAEMLRAAREALATYRERPLLIGVTVLTSLGAADLLSIGISGDPATQVERLTRLAFACGLDGVVCSPQEIAAVKAVAGAGFLTVTPGIRAAGADLDDQQRVATPRAAIAAGGDYLVIGRPITRAADPVAALADITSQIVHTAPRA